MHPCIVNTIIKNRIWNNTVIFHRKYSKSVLKCGIYLVDCEKYPKEQWNPDLKQRYDIWVENGKPELVEWELDDLEN